MKKASNGSGTQPRKRSDGRWEARFTAGTDPLTGKSIIRSVYAKTERECAMKLREATSQIDSKSYVAPNSMKFSAWLDEWINEFHGSCKHSTQVANESICRNHIKPVLGNMRIDRITPSDVQKFINGLAKKGISNKTIKNIHGTLSKAFAIALKLGMIRSNPATGAELPRLIKAEMKPLNDDEIAQFDSIVKGHMYEPIYKVLLKTGMRLGEVLGLRWQNVDFDNGTITVKGQLMIKRDNDHPRYIDSPKNGKERTFFVMPDVLKLLKEVRIKQHESRLKAGSMWESNTNTVNGKTVPDLVFTDAIGHNLCHSSIDACFQRLMNKAGAEHHRLHDLRHTFATQAIRCGVDIETLSKSMLGHSSVAITLDRYGHSTNDMQKEAIARLMAGWK